jgi:amidohydrolase
MRYPIWYSVGLACLSSGVPSVGQTQAPARDAALELALDRAAPVVSAAYRTIHAAPELGKQETRTQAYLLGELRRIGYTRFETAPHAPTAVIAVLDTHRPGRVIALRAEMDARRSQEPPDHDPRSSIDGVMHNCGHDAHAAMLLGAAAALYELRERLAGKLVFLFQPAEETAGGADDIVADDVLRRLGVDAIYAQHAVAGMSVNTVSVSPGAVMAGSSGLRLIVRGRQSHAAEPFRGGDVTVATARLVAGLVDLPARRLDLLNRPAVVSVASIVAGAPDQSNVLPDSAVARGTLRAFENPGAPGPDGAPAIAEVLTQYVRSTAAAYGVTAELQITPGPPPTVNEPALFAALVDRLRPRWPGEFDVTPYRGMFAEDFAYYTAALPALYFGLGIAKDGKGVERVHTPGFTVHPDALPVGLSLLVLLALVEDGAQPQVDSGTPR